MRHLFAWHTMKRLRNKPDPIHAPLNGILGREANVSVLRVLNFNVEPMELSELAEPTGLRKEEIARTVALLEELGVVEGAGDGKRRQVRLSDVHPLASALSAIFYAESRRMKDVVVALLEAVTHVEPPPLAAWIQDPQAEDRELPANALIVALLGEERDFDAAVASFRKAVGDLERRAHVLLEFRGLTEAELAEATVDEADAFRCAGSLAGPHPDMIVESYRDQRRENPGRQPSLTHAQPFEGQDLHEWARSFLVRNAARRRNSLDDGDRAERPRQALTVKGKLSQEEQDEIMKETGGAGGGKLQ
jgi:DNA-binding transcriptional ArsR family regulator